MRRSIGCSRRAGGHHDQSKFAANPWPYAARGTAFIATSALAERRVWSRVVVLALGLGGRRDLGQRAQALELRGAVRFAARGTSGISRVWIPLFGHVPPAYHV